MEELFLQRFADAIERDEEINPDDEFRNYEEWDSLASLSLVSMLDDEYGLNISYNELEKMKTVKNIFNFIVSKST